jgi:hypothetical protein
VSLSPSVPLQESLFGHAIQRRFLAFHRANPFVYLKLVELARRARDRGMTRYGIRRLWEVMRWEIAMDIQRDGEFRLNDHFHSRYARLIMEQEPDLAGFFETRFLRSGS